MEENTKEGASEDHQPSSSFDELSLHVSSNPNVTTFMYDNELPSLPLPTLAQTLDRYVESCRPLVTEEELSRTKAIVDKFQHGIGTKLHNKLFEKAKTHRNWLEDWWLQHAYLNSRIPLIPYMSTGGPHTLHLSTLPPSPDKAILYAAVFLHTTLCYFNAVRQERISPQFSVKGQTLSMDQFRGLFNTCRIPGDGTDSLYSSWKTEREGDCSKLLLVLCHGHIWMLNPFDSEGNILSLPSLERQFHHIRDTSDRLGLGDAVGTLTCDNRDSWAKNRTHLMSLSDGNKRLMRAIEDAMFVMVLDDSEPKTMTEVSWECLCGDPGNRWADKSLSGITTRTGYVCVNCEHTRFDAMVLVVLTHYQQTLLKRLSFDEMRREPVNTEMSLPQLQNFALDETLRQEIKRVYSENKENTSNVVVNFEEFMEFGKTWMKKNKVHPDSFVQVAFQLAYYRTHHRMASTYETATTRQFYHGRTETMRSCTSDVKLFVQAMQDYSSTISSKASTLRTACATHDRVMKECQDGMGVDRHMLGLYIVSAEEGIELPEIFSDPSYFKTGGGGNYVLSTSTLGSVDSTGGAVPMVEDGYGCFYATQPHKVYLFITNFRTGDTLLAQQFSAVICTCLSDMRLVLESATPPSAKL